MTTLTIRDHVAAAILRLQEYADDAGIVLNAYRAGEVPAYPGTGTQAARDDYYPYVVVTLFQRTDTGPRRISDDSLSRPGRILTLVAGRRENEALWVEEHVDAALRGYRLVVEGFECSPLHYEAQQGIVRDPDQEELYVGASAWTFVSTPQP